jgi:16S rRNA (cytosine967-C5)-methyltransferase
MAVTPEVRKAYSVLERVFHDRDHIQPLVASLDRGGRGIGRITDIAYGVARWALYLDGILAKLCARPLEALDREVVLALRIGLYQLVFTPQRPDYAVVDEAAELVRERGRPGAVKFVNAVLRAYLRRPAVRNEVGLYGDLEERLAVRYSHPRLLVRRWVEHLGHRKAEAVLQADQEVPRLDLLVDLRSGSREELAEELVRAGVTTHPSALSPGALVVDQGRPLDAPAELRRRFYIEDAGCQAFAWLFSRLGGERLWDAAAAPGGKTLALSRYHRYRVHLASDLFPTRLMKMKRNLDAFGSGAVAAAVDARRPALRAGYFDRILLDAPCSGTGVLRKNPEARWRLEEGTFAECARRQRELLEGVIPHLAPGGFLLYMTCSLEPEENEEMVGEAMEAHPELEVVRRDRRFPAEMLPFQEKTGWFRLLPSRETDGFSGVVIKKAEP